MNRREFIKATSAVVAAMATGFGGLKAVIGKAPKGVPAKYRGFNISMTKPERYKGAAKQLYATNGKHRIATLFDSGQSDDEIWKIYKPAFDTAIDRYENFAKNPSESEAHRLGYVPTT